MEQFKPFRQKVQDGEYTEIRGTAKIGRGTKRHIATRTIDTVTGRTVALQINGSCPIGSTRTRFAGSPNGFLPLHTNNVSITCGHCEETRGKMKSWVTNGS